MISSDITMTGREDLLRRVARLGLNLKDLRRPSASIAKSAVLANRQRLDRGVDVNGAKLRSIRAGQLGLTPLGGGSGTFGVSLKGTVGPDGPELYSNFIGAGIAYHGGEVRPKHAKYLWIPARVRGGRYASPERAVKVLANRRGDRSAHYSRESTFVLRRQGGRLLMVVQKVGTALRILAFLVKRMRYPANEWAGFSDADQESAMGQYGKHLDTFGGG